jgi:7,8-dihydroneopterin aldolase/epimerase/oxygenase
MWTISIKDAKFYATHGIYAAEQVLGNELLVNVSIEIGDRAINHLSDTIDYATVYGVVEHQMAMQKPLLEQVVQAIAAELEEQFSNMLSLRISIQKMAPNFGKMILASEISLQRSYTP